MLAIIESEIESGKLKAQKLLEEFERAARVVIPLIL